MHIKISIVNDKIEKELELADNATPFDVLRLLEIPPDTVIITRDEKPIPIDTQLSNDDQLAVIRVVSGG
jgi:sulfur carrier protein ThiS